MTEARTVTVFGGTGFLGRRIVRHLRDRGFAVRVASRHPEGGRSLFGGAPARLDFVRADINDDRSVEAAVAGAFAAVNAVSLYVERGDQTFRSVHVEAAARLAGQAQRAGVARLVHISGIGADAASTSPYIRSRGEGESAVRDAFPTATILRSAVMFGPDDAFLTPILKMLRTFPAFPLFGDGQTRLQPSHVDDVAEAVARVLDAPDSDATYELGGPQVYAYEELLRRLAEHLGRRPVLVPVPFEAWQGLAFAAELLPRPPVTRNQIELMRIDNVASPDRPGFSALGIAPLGIMDFLTRRAERTD